MIQLVDIDDIRTKRRRTKKEKEISNINIPLIGLDEVKVEIPKVIKIDKNTKIIIKENISKHKKYQFWRWKIKRILIDEKIIEDALNWQTVLDIYDPIIMDILVNEDIINKPEFKEKLKNQRSLLIEHHTKYKEIHGIDETKWMTTSEHRNLHNRLRREEKCDIPSEELAKISRMAVGRTKKRKEQMIEYAKKHYQKEVVRQYHIDYDKTYTRRIMFVDTLARNIRLYEEFSYNSKTNVLTVSSGFTSGHGIKIPTVYI